MCVIFITCLMNLETHINALTDDVNYPRRDGMVISQDLVRVL